MEASRIFIAGGIYADCKRNRHAGITSITPDCTSMRSAWLRVTIVAPGMLSSSIASVNATISRVRVLGEASDSQTWTSICSPSLRPVMKSTSRLDLVL